jgi:hypothetical protein
MISPSVSVTVTSLIAHLLAGVLHEQPERHGSQVFAAEADRQSVCGGILLGGKCSVNARHQRGAQG